MQIIQNEKKIKNKERKWNREAKKERERKKKYQKISKRQKGNKKKEGKEHKSNKNILWQSMFSLFNWFNLNCLKLKELEYAAPMDTFDDCLLKVWA